MKDNKYCIGIVGFGGMAGWHYDLITKRTEKEGIDNLTIKGVYDINPARMKVATERGLIAYETLDALLCDADIDIVLCATPNDVHKSVTIKALEAGKNVVCEKPVAMNSIELQEMIDAANKAGKLFVVHQNRRWDEDFLTIKKIYDEGTLGTIFSIESRVHGSRGIPGDWRGEVEHGGGMMLDWGVHIIDQILQLVKEPIDTIHCTVTNVTNEIVEDGFKLNLTYKSGLSVLLEVGTSNFIELPRWYVLGRDGTAVVEDWALNGKMVHITDWNKNDAVPIKTAAGLTKTMAPRTDETIKSSPLPIVHSDIREFYKNVTDTIEGKTSSLIKHEELLKVMRLMEIALDKNNHNKVIKFNG